MRRCVLCAVLLVGACPSALRAGLVAQFPLDGDLVDATGNGNDGTAVGGAPVFVDGHDGTPGGALSLDGVDDYVNVAQTAGLPLTDHPSFSVTAWVKAPQQADKRIFSESSTTDNSPLYNIGSDNTGATGALNFFIRRNSGAGTAVNHVKTTRAAFDGEWHHIAVVSDNGTLRTYIDGVPDRTLDYVLDPFDANVTTLGAILRGSACCYLTGALDDVRLYDHALKLEEILELVPVPAGCIARFAFDGDTLDTSGSGNDGTFTGTAETYVEGFDGTPGGALSLSGDDYVNVLQTTGLPLTDNPSLTVTMWVKAPQQADKRLFSEGSNTDNSPLYNIGSDNTGATGALDLFIRRDTGQGTPVNHFKTGRAAFDDAWHHVAVVDDNGAVTLYIDGVREGSGFNYIREPMTTNTTTIGGILRGTACCFLTGALDEVRFYDRALSAEEVEARVPEPEGCPADGDTTCESLAVAGPKGDGPGDYTFTATNVVDSDGGEVFYIFTGVSNLGGSFYIGPQSDPSATVALLEGTWTVTCHVDDDIRCRDPAGTCSTEVTIITDPPREIVHIDFDGSLADRTGNGNDGTYVGFPNPLFVTGVDCAYPGAGTFNGTDQFVRIAQNDGLPIYNQPSFTIAMWVKGLPQPDRRVYSEGSSTSNNPLFNIGTERTGMTGQVDIFIRNESNATLVSHALSDGIAFDGTWHHIAWVDAGGNATLYIDGVADPAVFSYPRTPIPFDTSTVGGILRGSPCCWFAGEIDDVRVFNFALSSEEVAALAPVPPKCPPEVPQLPGDCNQDAARNIADILCYVRASFPSFVLVGPPPAPLPCDGDASSAGNLAVLDVDGNGAVNFIDGIHIAVFLFQGGNPPVQGPGCVSLPAEPFACDGSAACP